MKRSAPMKRTAFRRPEPPPRVPPVVRPLVRTPNYAASNDEVVPLPKENVARHPGYLRLVASLPCIHCGRPAPSQAAHADMGKGERIKTDDRTAFPACADGPGRVGCHTILGASGTFPRAIRRDLEQRYGRVTRATIRDMGLWPKDLAAWDGDE